MNYLDDKSYWKRKFDDDRRIQIENQNQNQNQNNYNPILYIVHKTNLQNTTFKNKTNENKETNIKQKVDFLKKELNTYKKLYYDETKKNEQLFSKVCQLKTDLNNRNIKLNKIHKIIK